MTIDFGVPLQQQCEAIWAATRENADREKRACEAPLVVRLWDGEMRLQHLVQSEYGGEVTLPSNDTGQIQIRHPFNHPVGQWIWDQWGRMQRGEGRNINITVEQSSSRIGGLIDVVDLELDADNNDQVIVANFQTDYERLKWYSCWSNPWFPEWIQWPQVFLLPGPITWVLAVMLDLQIQREMSSGWAMPSDPLDPDQRGDLDQSTYSLVVKPISFLDAMASGVLWGIAISRFKNFHELAKPMREDGEIATIIRPYLDGDPEPWPGANLRHGTRVVEFVDRSGSFTGTSHGGTIWDGLIRTIQEFLDPFIDTTESLSGDTSIPPEYYEPGSKRTQKELPICVWRDGEVSGLETYRYRQTMAKGIQIVTGGHSMPGVVCASA